MGSNAEKKPWTHVQNRYKNEAKILSIYIAILGKYKFDSTNIVYAE